MLKSSSVLIMAVLATLTLGSEAQFILRLPSWFNWGSLRANQVVHPDFPNIVEAASETDVLSSLVAAVQAAGLVDTLADAHLSATVFAPTNDAFAAAAEALGLTLEELLADTETLTLVLTYHVVPKRLPASHLSDGLKLKTLAGDDFTLKVDVDKDDIFIDAIGSKAKVLTADVTAGAAVVHVIDTVLLPIELETMMDNMKKMAPLFANIVEAAQSSDELSTLVAAVIAADLVDTLSNPDLDATVFAPTNGAFEDALALLGLTLDQLVGDVDTLTAVLTYHVAPTKLLAADLSDGQVIDTLNDDATLTVDLSDGVVIQAVGSKANVIQTDITAGSAVVHIIDAVLLPFALEEPEETSMFASIVEAAVATDRLSTLVEAVTAAGLVDTLSDPELEATVFAPTNRAFRQALNLLGLTLEELVADLETLTSVLTYHVVPVKALSTDLTDGQVLNTLSGDNTLTIVLGDEISVVSTGSTATVVNADITAGAGVVHVIDAVLLPFVPDSRK